MFTGIIECTAELIERTEEGSNVHFTFLSEISHELSIDQSVAHDGVCLTVIHTERDCHRVTAIDQTLRMTTMAGWTPGYRCNLERCTRVGDRLDGHIVQGHVDTVLRCIDRRELAGSWVFRFSIRPEDAHLVVAKGSISINGVSLTVSELGTEWCEVSIIPYTYEHTGFSRLRIGDTVHVEWDIIGKYMARRLALRTD